MTKTPTITPDQFTDTFTLPSGERKPLRQWTFTLHFDQYNAIKSAIEQVIPTLTPTPLNNNKNGNGLYEIIRQWAEQKR